MAFGHDVLEQEQIFYQNLGDHYGDRKVANHFVGLPSVVSDYVISISVRY